MDDTQVIRLVQQFLLEKGFAESLEALKRESGVVFEEDELTSGGQLCSMLYEFEELKASLDVGTSESEARERRIVEEELLSYPTTEPFPSAHETTLESLHAGNIIACRFSRDGSLFATGGTDRTIKISCGASLKELRAITSHAAPILALAWCPTESNLLLSTSMDGKAFLTDASTGEAIQAFSDHTKYATRAAWSPGGDMFATCGREQTVIAYRKVEERSSDGRPSFEQLVRRDFAGTPEALCFLDDNETLVVSVRDDNYLHYINLRQGDALKVNMNQTGDDHVSFAALDLALSPNGKYLLVSTDKSRLILYPVGMSLQLRNYYGATNDQLGQTRVCWHPSCAYIFCTSQDLKVFCWAVGTQRVVAQVRFVCVCSLVCMCCVCVYV